jgi:Apea-like HEPN
MALCQEPIPERDSRHASPTTRQGAASGNTRFKKYEFLWEENYDRHNQFSTCALTDMKGKLSDLLTISGGVSMHCASMTSKEKRIVGRDVATLFSNRAFLSTPTFEDIRRLGPFHPQVEYKGNVIYLSDEGISAANRLVNLISRLPKLLDLVSEREIDAQAQEIHSSWLEDKLEPTGAEFIDCVVDSLHRRVRNYEYLVKLEGIELTDQDTFKLGTASIQSGDLGIPKDIKFSSPLEAQEIKLQIKGGLWLLLPSRGGSYRADQEFQYRVSLTVGLLAVLGAILYNGSTISKCRIRALTSPLENRKAVSWLRWEVGGGNLRHSRVWGHEQDLPFSSDSITYLNTECFLAQLAALPDRLERNELENAIVLALYWFAEANRDRNPVAQFVKLWTCAECFFAIKKDEVSEQNAAGISATLTFGGFRIIDPKDYKKFRARVKKMYDLRSKAIHQGLNAHVTKGDLHDLAKWVGWVIISMTALSCKGVTTLNQVRLEISRLDQLSVSIVGVEKTT